MDKIEKVLNEQLMTGYMHINSKGIKYYLYYKDVALRGGETQRIYFFAKQNADSKGTPADLPPDFEVSENPRSGFLAVRKKKGAVGADGLSKEEIQQESIKDGNTLDSVAENETKSDKPEIDLTSSTPTFTLTMQVRVLPTTGESIPWVDAAVGVYANPGDTVQYLIEFTNTSASTIGDADHNVIIKDFLPEGLSYVSGSAKLTNSNAPEGSMFEDGWMTPVAQSVAGVKIGSYGPQANAYVTFSAKIPDNDQLPVYGENYFKNIAIAYTRESGSKLATAGVVVMKTEIENKASVVHPKHLQQDTNPLDSNNIKLQDNGTSTVFRTFC